ncbi:hypothetical protein ACIGKL_04350 [Pseudomonas sp. NPDC077186]|uniref:hypothetical protein n=1 Tax=Pseudomonas sp. NPDC077186 TaxID=3364421 RepID=UPI0037CBAE12
MPRYLWLAILPFFLGCAKDHNIPPAKLDYLELSRKNESFYTVKFASDADLLNVFKPEDSPVGGLLRCSLSSDNAANEDGAERYVASGLIYAVQPISSSGPFVFYSSIMFSESINSGRTHRPLEAQELREILSVRQSVPCVYRFTAYGFKPYYSEVLPVPVSDILRELDEGY